MLSIHCVIAGGATGETYIQGLGLSLRVMLWSSLHTLGSPEWSVPDDPAAAKVELEQPQHITQSSLSGEGLLLSLLFITQTSSSPAYLG